MRIFRIVRARARTFLAFAVILVVFALLPPVMGAYTRALVAWDVGTLLWLVLTFTMMAGSDIAKMRERAIELDDGAVTILIITSAASVASLVAIVLELKSVSTFTGEEKFWHFSLAALTILCSWLFVHTEFALHYAHKYYGDVREQGLQFPGPKRLDYWDFLYFSANLGAASQTSDVQITSSAMRRIVLAHTVLSFFFNTTILALGINVAAGLL